MLPEIETSDNGHEEENLENLQAVVKNLSELSRPDGTVVTMGKEQLSLLKQVLAHCSDGTFDEFRSMAAKSNFKDENEARRFSLAYDECLELGMSTRPVLNYMEALRGTNRPGGYKSNVVAALLDAVSHQKYTANQPRSNNGYRNARGPIT